MTLQDIKNAISFDKTQGIGLTLNMMVDCWYQMKLQTSDHETAVSFALDELAKTMLEYSSK